MNRAKHVLMGIPLLLTLGMQEAKAVPGLQLYIENAAYETSSETWVLSGDDSFKLWVIGNVGGVGSIYDVKLTAAVKTGESGSIALTSSTATAGLLPGVSPDPSTPTAPTALGLSADGAIPVTGDGSSLPAHGEYGTGISFYEWELGDLTLIDSPLADFSGTAFPTSFAADSAQINVYEVSITGYSSVHFDAFDHYIANNGSYKYLKAPFSHDAGGTAPPVPEPETYAMLMAGLGLLGLMGRCRKRRPDAISI